MKYTFFKSIAVAAVAIVVCACQTEQGPIKTETFSFADSTAYATVAVSAELPASYKGVSAQITNILHQAIDEHLSRVTAYEGQRFFTPFDGDLSDHNAFVGYYFSEVMKLISGLSEQDAEERASYIEEDESLTAERKAEIMEHFPTWEYEYALKKIEDTPRYVVFESQDYIYMGGAHGGVGGGGCLTFCKKDGSYVDSIIDRDAEEEMQPLLEEGLLSYFSDAGEQATSEDLRGLLLLEGDQIPLPAWQPYPTKDGLVFTYQQYEIAPYAAGMPSFVISFDKVAPFVTPEARQVLGI